MKTIIAPTDFSSVSDNACLYAAKMAEDIKADLVLLHVMELPLSAGDLPVAPVDFGEAKIEEALKQLRDKLQAETNNKVNILTENILGSVEYEIKELCNQVKPFAVIMGTHSYNMVERFFVGSRTVYSAKHLTYPVLVVPANLQYRSIKKIAFATDLKNIYEIPVHEMEMIVASFNAELQVFYVAGDKNKINRNSLPGLLLNHRLENSKPTFYFIEHEDIAKGVASLGSKHDTDLLMVIPKKHGIFHKSQTKDFISYSDIPVMALHENDVAEQIETV